jgi:hypothetical protein
MVVSRSWKSIGFKCTPVHGGADIGHVTIGRHDDGRKLLLGFLQLLQQRQPVHARHVDVGHHQIDAVVSFQGVQGFDTIPGE